MTPLDAAIEWIRKGFSPVPVPHKSKRPVLNRWQQLDITIEAASQYFNGVSQNIGLLLGDKFGSTDVDCDCPEASRAARELLPETGLIFGRQSKPFSHFFYRSDPPVRTVQFIDPLDHSTLIELRGLSCDGYKDLPAKLRTELAGILRWIVEGAVLYHREGLGDPPDVMAATEQYRQESDRLKEFFEDRCTVAAQGDANSWKKEKFYAPVTDLYPAYSSWAAASGDKHPLSKGLFDERLQKLGRKQDRIRPDGGRDTKQIRVWLGIRLRTAQDD